MTKEKTKRDPIYSSDKINQIVPFTEEEDYWVDCDGNYGFDDIRFRWDFEHSPDGKHLIRPVSEINPVERNATIELLVREAKRIASLFGYSPDQYHKLSKEFFNIVYMWYIVTGYPLSHLEKLIRDGYFKSPSDVEEFVLFMDDFDQSEEVMEYYHNVIRNALKNNENVERDENPDSEENAGDPEYCLSEDTEPVPEVLSHYDKETEHQLLERLRQIREEIKTNPGNKKALEEERKSIIARIYRMREEFLAENGITYEDFILWRREKQINNSWGWVKYPIEPEEEKDKYDFVEGVLLAKYSHINSLLNNAVCVKNSEEIKGLMEIRNRIEKALKKVRFAKLTPEERKVQSVKYLIDKIYRLGKNKNRLAFKLTQTAKAKIARVRCKAMREVLYRMLDEAWQKRKIRFASIPERYYGLHQIRLF